MIDGELACAVDQAQQPGADRGALQDTILRLAAEVRQQLGLQLTISRTLIDLKVVREFQRSVVEVIAQDPDGTDDSDCGSARTTECSPATAASEVARA